MRYAVMFSVLGLIFSVGLGGLFLAGLFHRFFCARSGRKTGQEITCRARVVDKSDFQKIGSYRFPSRTTECVAAFDTGKGVVRFFVPLWVYDSVQVGQAGDLTYRGERFVDFTGLSAPMEEETGE